MRHFRQARATPRRKEVDQDDLSILIAQREIHSRDGPARKVRRCFSHLYPRCLRLVVRTSCLLEDCQRQDNHQSYRFHFLPFIYSCDRTRSATGASRRRRAICLLSEPAGSRSLDRPVRQFPLLDVHPRNLRKPRLNLKSASSPTCDLLAVHSVSDTRAHKNTALACSHEENRNRARSARVAVAALVRARLTLARVTRSRGPPSRAGSR